MAIVAVAVGGSSLLLMANPAAADTTPPAGLPATVSTDVLPTAQVNGIVWAQTIVGNTVYATGRFTQGRPAGVAVGGAGSVTRTNLIAYDITTGVMTSFNHSLTGTNAEGRGIAASPDGKRLYVGGTFTTVDGHAQTNLAVFDISTAAGTYVSGFSGPNKTVRGVAATNTAVYVGGSFTTAGGQTRNKLAAYNSSGSIMTSWAPSVTGSGPAGAYVAAVVVVPAQGNLVIGGYFDKINGSTYYSSGAVKLTTGAPVPWASQSATYPIRHQLKSTATAGQGVGVTSLSTDGTQVYMTSYNYAGTNSIASPEGPAAINPANGNIIWINDCHGDSYSAWPVGQVLYSTGHPHDCAPTGNYPDGNTHRALAQTTYPTGTNAHTTNPDHGYADFFGLPDSTQLDWYPNLNTGTYSGSSQAAWSVVGNTNYIALGGEFTKAENVAQQGLVRYGVKAVAPNKRGPAAYTNYGVRPQSAVNASGQVAVTFNTTWDQDNAVLTYSLYRNGGTTAVYTKTVDTRFWKLPAQTFTDTGLTAGSYPRYRMVVTDPFGNSTTTYSLFDDTNPAIVYSGTWTNAQARSYPDYGSGIHYTATDGASATFTFTGTNIAYVSEKNTDRGTVSISIDGGAETVVNVNGALAFQQTVYSKTGLTNATHTIKVTKRSGTYLDVDGFLVK